MNPEDRLLPDNIIRELKTSWVGKSIRYVAETGSTNADGLSLLAAGVVRGTVVIAEKQTAGKGRAGRTWVAPPGCCLTFSILVVPVEPPKIYPLFTFAAALAACEAVRQATQVTPTVKWPNDIYLSGKKLGGVLVEVGQDPDGRAGLVVGVGLNVNLSEAQIQSLQVDNATSIQKETGYPVSRSTVLIEYMEEFERRADRLLAGYWDEVISDWRSHSETIGRQVEVQVGDRLFIGYAEDVSEDGSLWVRPAFGPPEKISLSEIRHLR